MRLRALACTGLAALISTVACAQSSVMAQPGGDRRGEFARLPLTFERNQGQTSPEVQFLSRGQGYTAFLTAGSIVLSLRADSPGSDSSSGSATVELSLVGAAKHPAANGEDPQAGRVNYFLGSDPSLWRTNISTFGRVRYANVYPGIDLVYYGNSRQLEYDFEIEPGADPRQIQFAIQGARQIRSDGHGNLVLALANGEIRLQSPTVYQRSGGQRVPVEGAYVVTDSTHVGFQVSHYDASRPLVIDPVLVYSTYLGGAGLDQVNSIGVDGSGNVYIAGYTSSPNFPLTILGSPAPNANHVFVAKLNPTGTSLIYADYIGGNSNDYGLGLVLDSANNLYVTGSTTSSNFPVVGAYQAQQPGPYSGFVAKISSSGSSLLYSTYLGGNTFDQPVGIAIDSLGEVHVAGYTDSPNFPVASSFQSTVLPSQGGSMGTYGFLTKFNTSGSALVYSTYLAGNTDVGQPCGNSTCWPAPYSAISALAVDANGNAYVAGTTNTNNFPVTSGVYQGSNTTTQDATLGFVSKFSGAGNLDYSTYFYGASGDPVGISAIAVDGSGSAYITGTADSDGTFPVTSTGICDPNVYGFNCGYAFVTKFDAAASTLLYSTFLGPNNFASPQSLALDANGDAYVLSSTTSSLVQTNNAIESYTAGVDILLVEIDPAADTQLFSTYLGGGGTDIPGGILVDANANIYVTGYTASHDFPATEGSFQSQSGGGSDAFIMKISPGATLAVALSPYSLQYAALNVGTTSPAQQVLLRNMSSGALAISSVSTSGDYAETDNCAPGIAAASSCTISITFTPTAAGTRTGTVQISDTAAGSPHTVALSGIGNGAAISLNPAGLTFSSVQVGSSSSAQPVTLTNQGNANLNISNIQVSGDYSQTNNCPSTLAATAGCTINVTFTPTVAGSRSGTLSVNDNIASSPQTVSLSGSGSDFSLTTSSNSDTVKAGATATYTVTVGAVAGTFSSAVNLACFGAPAHATCSVSPASATPGSSSTNVTVTVTTTGASAALKQFPSSREGSALAVWMAMPGLGLCGLLIVGAGRRNSNRGITKSGKKTIQAFIIAVIFGILMLMTGCAGGTGIAPPPTSGTPTGTYTLTVSGTSGSLQHSLSLTLTVQ